MADENLSLAASITNAANRLLDVTEEHCEEVKKASVSASQSATSLAASAARLENASDAIPKTLATEVKASFDGAAEMAAALLSSKFTKADEKAAAAAKRYEGAVEDYKIATKMLRWHVVIPVGVFCIGVSVIVLAFAYFSIHSLIPSNDEIQERRTLILHLDDEIGARQRVVQKADEQIGKLNKKIQILKRAGGTLKLVDCRDAQDQARLCVNVSDGQQWAPHLVEELVE